jgi:hypothetical protein
MFVPMLVMSTWNLRALLFRRGSRVFTPSSEGDVERLRVRPTLPLIIERPLWAKPVDPGRDVGTLIKAPFSTAPGINCCHGSAFPNVLEWVLWYRWLALQAHYRGQKRPGELPSGRSRALEKGCILARMTAAGELLETCARVCWALLFLHPDRRGLVGPSVDKIR